MRKTQVAKGGTPKKLKETVLRYCILFWRNNEDRRDSSNPRTGIHTGIHFANSYPLEKLINEIKNVGKPKEDNKS